MAAPTPTSAPKAAARFIKGKVMARPEMASAPTPWPMKMPSVILYSDEAVMAMTEGSAYCINRRHTLSVPSAAADFCPFILYSNRST
ncbi:MAG: hypothetical protein BWY83_01067 [bacterium ADurb.Bin478]|nr:MAG: hypothetical protein BWY83_01067 [bacterium ADurb.Bin478]